MKNYPAKLDRKLHQYFTKNGDALSEYVELKKKFSYSKREYQIQKDKFFRKIIKTLSDN